MIVFSDKIFFVSKAPSASKLQKSVQSSVESSWSFFGGLVPVRQQDIYNRHADLGHLLGQEE